MDEPAQLLAAISRRHGLALSMVGAAGGESGGAWVVEDRSGARFLLKAGSGPEFRIDDAAAITARLRERGYPLPAYKLGGRVGETRYVLREMVPGRPLERIDGRMLARIFELNELQRDAAAGIAGDWRATVIESVLTGFDDWCVLDTLRRHSAETAALLAELQVLVQQHAAGSYRISDAVHWDFNAPNIVIDGGEIRAVIDWEGARAGDRAFDLATLLFYHHDDLTLRDLLWRRARAIASDGAIAVYLAHMIVRQVDWSLRHHPPQIGELYIALARSVLRDLRG